MLITIEHHAMQQNQIKVYGRRVGYCTKKPPIIVSFLPDSMSQLSTDREKMEVLCYVRDTLGPIKKGKHSERYFPHDDGSDDRSDTGSERRTD